MEAVKNWVFSFCITAVAGGIVHMLIPRGNMEKVIKITVRIFLLAAIVSPLVVEADFEMIKDYDLESQTEIYTQKFREETRRIIERELSNQVENIISESLAEIEVYPDEVEAFVVSLSENEATVDKIGVTLRSNYKIKDSDIRYKISRIADCQVNVIYTEENRVEG